MSMSSKEIMDAAIEEHKPVKMYAGFSGGGDSTVLTHWLMTNYPQAEVVHINTGIGIEATRDHVRKVCADYGWPLTEIRAKEDCGQDYDALVKQFGFPGPAGHHMMYARLKERCVRKLVRDAKTKRRDKVMIATGIYQEESNRRAGYGGRVINTVGSQLWVNPLYFWKQEDFAAYKKEHNLPVNPVSQVLGMSGECLCGAFAHKGEKDLIRIVCPRTADRIQKLEDEVLALGWTWGWEDRPPRGARTRGVPGPLCIGCEK